MDAPEDMAPLMVSVLPEGRETLFALSETVLPLTTGVPLSFKAPLLM